MAIADVYPEDTCARDGHDFGDDEDDFRCNRCMEVNPRVMFRPARKDQEHEAEVQSLEVGAAVELDPPKETVDLGALKHYKEDGYSSIADDHEAEAKAGVKAEGRPLDLPYVANLLHSSAELFAKRNAVYKDNFRMVGRIMTAMFPDGPPKLETAADYNRWHLFELAIVKLSRYAVKYNEGGHPDSIDDMIVYLAMVAALDAENGHRA